MKRRRRKMFLRRLNLAVVLGVTLVVVLFCVLGIAVLIVFCVILIVILGPILIVHFKSSKEFFVGSPYISLPELSRFILWFEN